MVDSPLERLLGWFPWSVHTSSIVWDYIMKVRFDSQAFIIVLMFLDILLDHIHLVVQYQQVVHSNVPTKKLVNTCWLLLRERRKSKLQFGDGKRTSCKIEKNTIQFYESSPSSLVQCGSLVLSSKSLKFYVN